MKIFSQLFFFCAFLLFSQTSFAATVSELFLRLPDEQVGGLSVAERQYHLDQAFKMRELEISMPGTMPPDVQYPWIHVYGDNYMTLQRPNFGPISFKVFNSPAGFQLLTICRGRQLSAIHDPSCELDLCFYRAEGRTLAEVNGRDYLPPIGVLDFVTADTLHDKKAAEDLAVIEQTWTRCLTCHASSEDGIALDIITTTNINAKACEGFLPAFEILPLAWNGQYFKKPYDRAAVEAYEAQIWNKESATQNPAWRTEPFPASGF